MKHLNVLKVNYLAPYNQLALPGIMNSRPVGRLLPDHVIIWTGCHSNHRIGSPSYHLPIINSDQELLVRVKSAVGLYCGLD